MVKQISRFVILAVVFHIGLCQLLFATNLDYGFTIHGNEDIGSFINKLNGSYGSNYSGDKIVRLALSWKRIMLTKPDLGTYEWVSNFSGFDNLVTSMQNADYDVMIVVGGTPRWATDPIFYDLGDYAPPNSDGLDRFEMLIDKAVERYTTDATRVVPQRVTHYQIYNEPNGHGWLRHHTSKPDGSKGVPLCFCNDHGYEPCSYAIEPEEYVAIIRTAWCAAKTESQNAKIVFAGLANSADWYLIGGDFINASGISVHMDGVFDYMENLPDVVPGIDFAGKKAYYHDVMAVHTYCDWYNPYLTVQSSGKQAKRSCYKSGGLYAASFKDIAYVHQALTSKGLIRQIWVTEFGYSSWDSNKYMASACPNSVNIWTGINSDCASTGLCLEERWVSEKVQRFYLMKALHILDNDDWFDTGLGNLDRVYLYEFMDQNDVTDEHAECGGDPGHNYITDYDDFDGVYNPDLLQGWDPIAEFSSDTGCVEKKFAKERELGFGICDWLRPGHTNRHKQVYTYLSRFLGSIQDQGWAWDIASCRNCNWPPTPILTQGKSYTIRMILRNLGSVSVPWSRPEYFAHVYVYDWYSERRIELQVINNEQLINTGSNGTFKVNFSASDTGNGSPGIYNLYISLQNSCNDVHSSNTFSMPIILHSNPCPAFSATPGIDKTTLFWEKADPEDGIGYRVYRSVINEELGLISDVLPINQNYYEDTFVQPCIPYYYAITLVKSDGSEETLTQEISASTATSTSISPAEVDNLMLDKKSNDVRMVWDEIVNDAYGNPLDVAYYSVYRGRLGDFRTGDPRLSDGITHE